MEIQGRKWEIEHNEPDYLDFKESELNEPELAMSADKSSDIKIIKSFDIPNLTTNISCNSKNGIKYCFGCFEKDKKYLEVLSCDTDTITQLTKKEISQIVRKVMWIPDPEKKFPELLMVADQDLCIYEYIDSELIMKSTLSGIPKYLVSFDWNYWDPTLIATLEQNGECTIWSIEDGKNIFTLSDNLHCNPMTKLYHSGPHFAGMTFAHSTIDNCILTYNNKNKCLLHDLRDPCAKYLGVFPEPILDMKFSLNSPLVAYFSKRSVNVLDVRYPSKNCYIFKNFKLLENGTSFSWSPFHDEMIMGTTNGICIIWDLQKNRFHRASCNKLNFIRNIQYHPSERDFLISASKYIMYSMSYRVIRNGFNILNLIN